MYPLSDNDMDRLSREAAEQFDVEQSTSGWDRLEKKLDKELPREKERRRILWFFLLLLLLGGGTLSLILINDHQNTSLSKVHPVNPASGATQSQQETTPAAGQPSGAASSSANPEAPVAATHTESSTKNPVTAATPVTGKQDIVTVKDEITTKISSGTETNTTKKSITRQPFRSGNAASATTLNTTPLRKTGTKKTYTAEPATDNTTAEKNTASGNDVSGDNTVTTPVTINQQSANPAKPVEPAPADTLAAQKPAAPEKVAVVSTPKSPEKSPAATPSRWAIGTTLGADWSRIHGTGDKRMGYNAGILVSYNITKRLSVSTGALVTRKMYSALGKDFNPPKHYWTSYVKLESLDGYCQMIDIPLNIRYDFSAKGNNRWYASAGLSSYLMTSQFYNYYYYNNANQYTEKSWKNNANSEYWMGILNLSAGYERILNRKWSLQAEPFLKVPLKGVGFGKMDISTFGTLFTLKYHPKF